MLRRFLTRPIGTPAYDALLGEIGSGVAGLGIIAVGAVRVFALELDEPARLLGLAVAVMLGLAIVAIGLPGSIKVRLTPRSTT